MCTTVSRIVNFGSGNAKMAQDSSRDGGRSRDDGADAGTPRSHAWQVASLKCLRHTYPLRPKRETRAPTEAGRSCPTPTTGLRNEQNADAQDVKHLRYAGPQTLG
jgi:hypothetical protein